MGLLDFLKSTDPFKGKVGERSLAKGKVLLLTETADMVVSSSAQTVRLVTHTIMDEIWEHFGKKKRKVGFYDVLPPVKKDRTGGVAISELVVTTTGKSPAVIQNLISHSGYINAKMTSFLPMMTMYRRAMRHYVILTSSSESPGTDNLTSPIQADVDVVTTEPINETRDSSIPRTETGTSLFVLDCVSLADDFYDSQTIDAA
ncbi:hypothetical protein Tco_0731117, partial [Tanacetum coccineum]